MNATYLARQAYAPGQAPLRSARSAELSVFAEVTARLNAALVAGFPALVAAIHDNRRLWTRIAADVSDDGNGLDPDLRARIFWLAEFTDHHSRRVLAGEAGAEPLIEINTAMIRGLGGRAAARVPS